MGYRLIALDVDGTIRDTEYPISDRTRQAIARAIDTGAMVTLATGRMLASALPFSKQLGLSSPIVSYQGALVSAIADSRTLWHRPLTEDMVRQALAALSSYPLQVMMYMGGEVFVSHMTPWVRRYADRNTVKIHAVKSLTNIAAGEPTRLVVVGEEDEITHVSLDLKALFNTSLYITRSLPIFCEILHPLGGKANALAWLCKWAEISPQDTLAFGNGPNDIDMIQWANLGVAMEGSPPEVLEIADRMAPPADEDGAAQVLEDLLDQGLIGP